MSSVNAHSGLWLALKDFRSNRASKENLAVSAGIETVQSVGALFGDILGTRSTGWNCFVERIPRISQIH